MAGVGRVIQTAVFMGDPFSGIGADQGIVQQLPLLMGHIRDQQRKKDVEPLDLGGQLGFFDAGAVQKIVHRVIHPADLHNIDAVAGGRRNADELPAHIGAGPVELMALERGDNKDLDAPAPHPGGHQLHGEALAGAAGTQDGNIRVFVNAGVENIDDDQRVVVLVHPQQDAVVIAHLIADARIATGRPQGQDVPLRPLKEPVFQRHQGEGR